MLGNLIIVQIVIANIYLVIGVSKKDFNYISEFCHTILHAGAFLFSFYASIKAKKKANSNFTFGYNRYETVAAFTNCIFLVMCSLFVLMSSFHSLHHDGADLKENTKELIGDEKNNIINLHYLYFLFNIVGVFSLSEYSLFVPLQKPQNEYVFGSVSNQQLNSFKTDYQYVNQIWGHQKFGENHVLQFSSHYENMHTIFLHFLIDFLLQVGKIAAYHLVFVDNCEIYISLFTLFVTIIVCKNIFNVTGRILLNGMPGNDPKFINDSLKKILIIDGVLDIEDRHFWALTTGFLVCDLTIRIRSDGEEDVIYNKIQAILQEYFQEISIQFEKN